MGRAALVCGAAALALAACGKKGGEAASADNAGKPAAGQASASTPAALPTRKPGLWEQTMNSERVHQTIRMCVDEAVEQKIKWWSSEGGRGPSNCSDEKLSRTLSGGWTIHSVCTAQGMTVTTDGTATGDFGAGYHMDLTTVTTGSPMPQANGARKMSLDSTWKGPCPAGMKGGDVDLPGGMRINPLDAASGPPDRGFPRNTQSDPQYQTLQRRVQEATRP
jgi:hypothetical protein